MGPSANFSPGPLADVDDGASPSRSSGGILIAGLVVDFAAGVGADFFLLTADLILATADSAAALILAMGLALVRVDFAAGFVAGAVFFGVEELFFVFIRAGARSISGFRTQPNAQRLGRR